MKRIFITFLGVAASLTAAYASTNPKIGGINPGSTTSFRAEEATDSLSIELTEAGGLSSKVTVEQLGKLKKLRVAGNINHKDISLIKKSMSIIEVLDLRNAKIMADTNSPADYPENCLPSEAFRDKKTLTNIYLPKTLKTIKSRAFQKTKIKSIVLPDAVDSVGDFLFSFCYELENVTISKNLKALSRYMFNACAKLSSVELPEGLETLKEYAFAGCTLSSIKLPNTLKEIGSAAFDKNKFTKIDIPASVVKIGSQAFREVALTKVKVCPMTAPEAGDLEVFDAGTFETAKLQIFEKAENSYRDSSMWSRFKNIELIKGDTPIVDPDPIVEPDGYLLIQQSKAGSLAGKLTAEQNASTEKVRIKGTINYSDLKILRRMRSLKELDIKDVTIEAVTLEEKGKKKTYGVGFIPYNTFADRVKLSKVLLPSSLDSIGITAFSGTSLAEIVIPANVQLIDYQAFFYCQSLTKAIYEEGSKLVGTGKSAFSNCIKLSEVQIPSTIKQIDYAAFYACKSLTNFVVPEGIEIIKGVAFYNGGLQEVTLPATLKNIDQEAFAKNMDLKKITVLSATTAPEVHLKAFDPETIQNAHLYVHKAAWDSFHDHRLWSQFPIKNVYFIEGGQPVSVTAVTDNEDIVSVQNGAIVLMQPVQHLEIFTIDGRRVGLYTNVSADTKIDLPKGIYVVTVGAQTLKINLR